MLLRLVSLSDVRMSINPPCQQILQSWVFDSSFHLFLACLVLDVPAAGLAPAAAPRPAGSAGGLHSGMCCLRVEWSQVWQQSRLPR